MTEPRIWTERASEYQLAMFDRIFGAAGATAVWGNPVERDGYTVLTASEVSAGAGFGIGFGSVSPADVDSEIASNDGSGGGGGGGGGSRSRPVAVVSIGPAGVRVESIVDVTKLAIMAVIAWTAMLAVLFKMRRKA